MDKGYDFLWRFIKLPSAPSIWKWRIEILSRYQISSLVFQSAENIYVRAHGRILPRRGTVLLLVFPAHWERFNWPRGLLSQRRQFCEHPTSYSETGQKFSIPILHSNRQTVSGNCLAVVAWSSFSYRTVWSRQRSFSQFHFPTSITVYLWLKWRAFDLVSFEWWQSSVRSGFQRTLENLVLQQNTPSWLLSGAFPTFSEGFSATGGNISMCQLSWAATWYLGIVAPPRSSTGDCVHEVVVGSSEIIISPPNKHPALPSHILRRVAKVFKHASGEKSLPRTVSTASLWKPRVSLLRGRRRDENNVP